MKKTFALLLAALFCLAPLTVCADEGFLLVANILMNEDILGEPTVMSEASETYDIRACVVWFFINESSLMLSGEDSKGRILLLGWENRDPAVLMSTLYAFCAGYENLSAACANGLTLAVRFADDADPIYVENLTAAQTLAGLMIDGASVE